MEVRGGVGAGLVDRAAVLLGGAGRKGHPGAVQQRAQQAGHHHHQLHLIWSDGSWVELARQKATDWVTVLPRSALPLYCPVQLVHLAVREC